MRWKVRIWGRGCANAAEGVRVCVGERVVDAILCGGLGDMKSGITSYLCRSEEALQLEYVTKACLFGDRRC